MTNFNQNNNQFSNYVPGQFSFSQSAFQHGFAGTDAQEVRQQNAQSAQNQSQFGTGYQQNGQQFQNQGNPGQFSGPQAMFQHGSSGTNAQEVRQQNAQSAQNQSQFATGFQGNFGRFQ